jgi:hypothetical protein
MGWSAHFLERIDSEVSELSIAFGDYLDFIEASVPFRGASSYIHRKVLAKHEVAGTLAALSDDSKFFGFIHATLASRGYIQWERQRPNGARST